MTSGQDRRESANHPVTEDSFASIAEHQPRGRFRLSVIVTLVVTLTVLVTAVAVVLESDRLAIPWLPAFHEPSDSLIVISTRTPTPVPMRTSTPTRTRIVVTVPTRRSPLNATFTPAPLSTSTPTPSVISGAGTVTLPHSTIPSFVAELLPTNMPALPTKTSPPRVLARPPVPAPVLKEPRAGAEMPFGRVVRFKFVWSRELGPNERVMLYIRSIEHIGEFAWGASKEDILHGGGRIYNVEEGVLYEINAGFGNVPQGKAVWKVAIVLDTLTQKRQISPWSEERPIVRQKP
jgi:hypothetical protein